MALCATDMKKREIALTQLRAAIKCYVNEDYVSMLTLAAAAEEILGKIAKKRKGDNALESELDFTREIYAFVKVVPPDNKALINRINRVKNEVKHNDEGEDGWVTADFRYEAENYFLKAIKNYYHAYDEMPTDREICQAFDFITL
jgi:hypothetical protein